MTIGALLRSALVDNAGVVAIVGQRVYPVLLPQNPTYPAISYERISSTGQDGTSNRKESRYQINCWARTYAGVVSLSAAVKVALEEYHDADQTPGISWVRVVNELDDYDSEVDVFRIIVDVILHTTGD